PLAALESFDRERLDTERREMVANALGDGLDLRVGTPAADHEVVTDRRELGRLEDDQIVGLAIESGARALERPVPAGERHQVAWSPGSPGRRYRPCVAMYASTTGGTRNRIERRAATRAGIAVAEMSRAVMRCKLTPRPDAWRIVPLTASYRKDSGLAIRRSSSDSVPDQGGRVITTRSHSDKIPSGS